MWCFPSHNVFLFYSVSLLNRLKMTEYNEKWENDIDPNGVPYKMWCKRHNATSAWCRLCKRVLSVKVMGICAIRQHAGRKSHKKRLGEIQKEENE